MGGGPADDMDAVENTAYDLNVFVTGFGPFPDGKGGHHVQNASHLVTKLLPHYLNIDSPKDAGKDVERGMGKPRIRVRIENPTAATDAYLPTEYSKIRPFLQKVYTEHSQSPKSTERVTKKDKVDLYLHLGIADGWHWVTVERRAYQQGMRSSWWTKREENDGYYLQRDNAGKTVEDAGPNPWSELPIGLSTSFDVDLLVRDANERNGGQDKLNIQAHHEPGFYCCGYTYYESLAQCYSRGLTPNVLFCHVPGETNAASLEMGRDAIVAVIEAAVMQLLPKE